MDKNFNPEDTQFFSASSPSSLSQDKTFATSGKAPSTKEATKKTKSKKGIKWGTVVDGVAAGLVIGAVAASGMKAHAQNAANDVDTDEDADSGNMASSNHTDELSNPALVDGNIAVATEIRDDMTFSEAFAAARAEVGPGGVFEWHGMLYGTYTANEWSHMSPAERAEYESHFNWNNIDSVQANGHDYAHNDMHVHHHHSSEDAQFAASTSSHVEPGSAPAEVQAENPVEPGEQPLAVNEPSEAPEVEVIGIYEDPETGYTYGHLTIDEIDTLVVDIDGDQTFDVMIADTNLNGEFDEGDYMDNIQDANLTVSDLQDAYYTQHSEQTGDPNNVYQTQYEQPAEDPALNEVMNETDIYAQNDTMSDFINDADAGTYMA